MNYSNIEELKMTQLKEISKALHIKYTGTKEKMIPLIRTERTKLYEKIGKLGEPGRDAQTYEVKFNGCDETYAMKQFKLRKSPNRILKEVELQNRLAEFGICPKIIDFETTGTMKYIVMDKLDRHLIEVGGVKKITIDQQKQLYKIYQELDKAGVFHGDANPLNYMLKDEKLYVIDFGMSKEIQPSLVKQLGTEHPNSEIMTIGMILKLKLLGYPEKSYSFLLKQIPRARRESIGL